MRLQNTTVLVPGASRPIGRAIARKFAANGANLILPWFDWPESVDEMNREFHSMGEKLYSTQCDLRDISDVNRLCENIAKRFGSLNYLINNIERGGMPVVHGTYDHEHNREQWQLEYDTTVKAKWNLYHCAKDLLTGSTEGAVINISSIAAITGRSGPTACFFSDGYSSANRAIQTLTETWAREAAPDIRVNEVMLGLINGRHGENTRGWSTLSADEKQQLLSHTLVDRMGSPEDVADLVYFLAVEATFMTGSVVRLDGGYTLGGNRVPPLPQGIL